MLISNLRPQETHGLGTPKGTTTQTHCEKSLPLLLPIVFEPESTYTLQIDDINL